MNFGFKILGILALVYAILGFLKIKVWIQFEGFRYLSYVESLIFLLVGTLLIFVNLYLQKKD